jgi:hypothetical protein
MLEKSEEAGKQPVSQLLPKRQLESQVDLENAPAEK